MDMQSLLRVSVFVAATMLWLIDGMADEPTIPPISEDASNNKDRSGDGYWTKDRIDSAKPIDLPTPREEPKPTDGDENEKSHSESESGEGSAGE